MDLDPYVLGAALFTGLGTALLVPPPPHVIVRGGPSPLAEVTRNTNSEWRDTLMSGRHAVLPLGKRVGIGLMAGLAALLLLLDRIGWPAWVVAVIVGAGLTEFLARLESGQAQRRRRELVLQTPQALDLLSAALGAGLPLRLATAAVVRACPGPVADTLSGVGKQIELGVSDVAAWRALSAHPQLGPVAADLARSVESGTMLGAALAMHADEARAQRAAAVEIAARQVGVRSVLPLMLCFIPAFLLLGIVPTVVSAVLSALTP